MIEHNCQDSYQKTVQQFESEAIPHLASLTRFARQLLPNQAEAEDLVQDTFALAFKSFARYESGTNCRAWLCKIMMHRRTYYYRASARFCSLEANETLAAKQLQTELQLPPDYIGKHLLFALRMMPQNLRQAVWLRDVEGFSYREIAEKLDVPIGTVMSRISRARKTLGANFIENTRRVNTEN